MSWDVNAYIKGAKDVYCNRITPKYARKIRRFVRLEYFYFTNQKWYTLKRHNEIYNDGFYRVKNPILRLFIRDNQGNKL